MAHSYISYSLIDNSACRTMLSSRRLVGIRIKCKHCAVLEAAQLSDICFDYFQLTENLAPLPLT
jgi:hypothetical protein